MCTRIYIYIYIYIYIDIYLYISIYIYIDSVLRVDECVHYDALLVNRHTDTHKRNRIIMILIFINRLE